MISGNQDGAWPMYHVWPISERFMLAWFGGTWPACCHWLNTGTVSGRCPIMFVLTQSYPCDTWFFCSTLRELAVSNLGQLLFCRSTTWSRCRNAYRDLWIMTIERATSYEFRVHDNIIKCKHFPRYWPFVRGIHRPLVNSHQKGQWLGALMFFLFWPEQTVE